MHIETLPPADLPFVTREATVRDNVAPLALDAACRMGAGRWSARDYPTRPGLLRALPRGGRARARRRGDGRSRAGHRNGDDRRATDRRRQGNRYGVLRERVAGAPGASLFWPRPPHARRTPMRRSPVADTATAHQSRIFFTDIPASGLRLRGHGAFYIQLRRWADDGHERIGISGRVTQVAADSVLVRVAELRDSTGPTLRYEPQRETWLVRGLGVVEARNTDTGRTLIMVVLAAATVAAVIAAANAPQPTPKPSGGVSCW